MKTWEEIFCKAKEIGAAAGRKATDVADMARLKVRLAENDRAVESTMEALGRLLYDSHRCGSPIDEEIAGELYQQADELLKAQEAAENLRRQLKTYLDEASQAKAEASELKRQLFKAQQGHK